MALTGVKRSMIVVHEAICPLVLDMNFAELSVVRGAMPKLMS